MTKIYLISPPQLDLKKFSSELSRALETNLVAAFQLRLKNIPIDDVKKIAKETLKVCRDHRCQFLLNDDYKTALDIGADGVHVGESDGLISLIRRNSPENFTIGASCYDSKHLAMEAGEQGADYLSFGTFFPSKTKNSRGTPTTEIISWCDELLNLPSVAIGGITDQNCQPLVKAGVDFLAIISYVWDHPNGVTTALARLQNAINTSI